MRPFPPVGPPVRPSVGPSVTLSVMLLLFALLGATCVYGLIFVSVTVKSGSKNVELSSEAAGEFGSGWNNNLLTLWGSRSLSLSVYDKDKVEPEKNSLLPPDYHRNHRNATF